jgi:tetratricopeptide (TPR) repeat protein
MRNVSSIGLVLLVLSCGDGRGQNSAGGADEPKPGDATKPSPPPAPKGAHLQLSCGAATQESFDRGFFLLHNMMYTQARSAFEQAAAVDDKCAMVHWGIAMTYFQPLWPGQPTEEALENGSSAVDRAKAASTGATEKERDYIAAAATYYADWKKTDSAARLKNWEAGQKKLAERYPDDIEAQAFYALSRLSTVDRKDKTYAQAMEVAGVLEKLLAQRPDHPGLMHYMLHAYDNPVHAHHALEAARKYEDVAPDAPHALHMPSHIHVRLGNWKEVIDWNIKSAQAAERQPAAGERVSRDYLHALDYMTYGYLQIADDASAKAQVAKMDPSKKYELNSGPGAYALASTAARYAIERLDWKEAAALVVRRVDYTWDQFPWAEAVTHAARGLGAARTGNTKAAQKSIAELDRLKPLIESPWWQSRVEIERDVIAAWVAHKKRDKKKALALMSGAAKRELASGKDNVEPGHVINAAEQLGDLLVEVKQPKQALEAFKAALVDSPRRFNALYGAGRAAEQAGLADEAKTHYSQLVDMSAEGSDRPALAHARKFLGK